MKITKEEYRKELASLKKTFGVTDDEIEGIIEFFNDTLEIEQSGRKTRVFNSGRRLKRSNDYD